jgi:hypothetical protein
MSYGMGFINQKVLEIYPAIGYPDNLGFYDLYGIESTSGWTHYDKDFVTLGLDLKKLFTFMVM